MSNRFRHLIAMAFAVTLALTSASMASADPATTGPTTDRPTGRFEVAKAQFRWGMNNESNNRAFAPDTFNFFSAGKVPDPGRGGWVMPDAGHWKQAGAGDDANVSIEKYLHSTGGYRPATWAGLRTDSNDIAIATPLSRTFSNHQIVFNEGTGEVDVAQQSASIKWKGSYTVLYYSGMSMFYVSDPELTVTNGIGKVTATLSGFASSISDQSIWRTVPPAVVTIADLGRVDLSAERGFKIDPTYARVAISTSGQDSPQVTSTADFGSFPQTYVDFHATTGTGSFWYSSGGGSDPFKVPLPITVSYDQGDPIVAEAPIMERPAEKVTNKFRTPPKKKATPKATPTPEQPAPPASVPRPLTPDPVATQAVQATAVAQTHPMPTVLADIERVTHQEPHGPDAPWWIGGAALVMAMIALAAPTAYNRWARPPQ